MVEERVMRNFSAGEENLIRNFVFTNPYGEDSFIYPQPLVAGEELSPLMSAVSRTHSPMQTRVLQFLDIEKTEQTRSMISQIPTLMEIFRNKDGSLKISRRTGDFNREWVLAHGHDSIKEGTTLFGHSENVSDITGKKISGHPLMRPQAKSTRYISYGRVLDGILEDEDIRSLPSSGKFLEYASYMNRRYLALTEQLGDLVFNHSDTRDIADHLRSEENMESEVEAKIKRKTRLNPDFHPDDNDRAKFREEVLAGLTNEAMRKEVDKFVLDSSRVYLLAGTRTSYVYSVDARTLEEVITDLISSPRTEDQRRGNSIWNEAKKIAPVLLGEKSHVSVDEWKVKNEGELRSYFEERFGQAQPEHGGAKSATLLTPRDIEMHTDRFNAALAVFPYTHSSLRSIMSSLSETDVREVLEKTHRHRGTYDVISPSISHGGLMFELLMPYHGYRDLFRHRRGARSTQLLTTQHEFEVPEIVSFFGIEEDYARDIEMAKSMYEEARRISPHVAEKLVPFGANCRALHSWQANQLGYIANLRTDISKGNLAYVKTAREMVEQFKREMPETAKYLKHDEREYPPHLWKRGYEWFDKNRK
ncbi:MAG: hypothetical protein AABY10_05610 [Nanoarchaeota archaeon]